MRRNTNNKAKQGVKRVTIFSPTWAPTSPSQSRPLAVLDCHSTDWSSSAHTTAPDSPASNPPLHSRKTASLSRTKSQCSTLYGSAKPTGIADRPARWDWNRAPGRWCWGAGRGWWYLLDRWVWRRVVVRKEAEGRWMREAREWVGGWRAIRGGGGGLRVGRGGRGVEMGGRRGLTVDVQEGIFVALVEALAIVFAAQDGGVRDNVGIEVFVVAVVQAEGFEAGRGWLFWATPRRRAWVGPCGLWWWCRLWRWWARRWFCLGGCAGLVGRGLRRGRWRRLKMGSGGGIFRLQWRRWSLPRWPSERPRCWSRGEGDRGRRRRNGCGCHALLGIERLSSLRSKCLRTLIRGRMTFRGVGGRWCFCRDCQSPTVWARSARRRPSRSQRSGRRNQERSARSQAWVTCRRRGDAVDAVYGLGVPRRYGEIQWKRSCLSSECPQQECYDPVNFMVRSTRDNGDILERCRILPPSYPPRAIDCAHGTTRITIPSTMGHALGPRIRIYVFAILGPRYRR